MEEFLRQNYSFLTKLIEIIAAVAGIFVYKKYKATVVKYFIWFLVYVAFVELIGNYTKYLANYEFLSNFRELLKDTLFEKNYWWYTLGWTIGAALFYAFYFNKIIVNIAFKKTLRFLFWLLIIFVGFTAIIDIKELFSSFPKYIELLSFIIIILCVTFYFVEIIKSEKILTFYKSINFYISSVILFWWLITTPLLFYEVYFSTLDWNYVILSWQIRLFANIIMYSMFTFTLIWCKPQNV